MRASGTAARRLASTSWIASASSVVVSDGSNSSFAAQHLVARVGDGMNRLGEQRRRARDGEADELRDRDAEVCEERGDDRAGRLAVLSPCHGVPR
jgi:hypothetical protein